MCPSPRPHAHGHRPPLRVWGRLEICGRLAIGPFNECGTAGPGAVSLGKEVEPPEEQHQTIFAATTMFDTRKLIETKVFGILLATIHGIWFCSAVFALGSHPHAAISFLPVRVFFVSRPATSVHVRAVIHRHCITPLFWLLTVANHRSNDCHSISKASPTRLRRTCVRAAK